MDNAQPPECPKYQNRDLSQSKSIIPNTRMASSLVMFTGGFDLVVACNTRRATTSPYAIAQSASMSIELVNQLTNSTRHAATISLQFYFNKGSAEPREIVAYQIMTHVIRSIALLFR